MSRLSVTGLRPEPGSITKQCAYCGNPFDGTVYKQRKYCPGRKCRQNAYLDRNEKDHKAEQEKKYLKNLKKRLEKKIHSLTIYLRTVNSKLLSFGEE